MRAVTFKCPDCRVDLLVQYLIWEGEEARLVARCDSCQQNIRFSVDEATANLLNMNFVPRVKVVN